MFCSPSNPSSSASEIAIELVHLIGCSILLLSFWSFFSERTERAARIIGLAVFPYPPFFLLMMDHPTFSPYFPTFSINRSPTSAQKERKKKFFSPDLETEDTNKKNTFPQKMSRPFCFSRLREEAKELINSSTTKANRTQTDVTEKLGERIQVCERFVGFFCGG